MLVVRHSGAVYYSSSFSTRIVAPLENLIQKKMRTTSILILFLILATLAHSQSEEGTPIQVHTVLADVATKSAN